MIHAREDYQWRFGDDPALEDPSLLPDLGNSTPIWYDEPVMLFRAQDRYFIPVLRAYSAMLALDSDAKGDILQAIERHIKLADEWQQKNTTKTPDLPLKGATE